MCQQFLGVGRGPGRQVGAQDSGRLGRVLSRSILVTEAGREDQYGRPAHAGAGSLSSPRHGSRPPHAADGSSGRPWLGRGTRRAYGSAGPPELGEHIMIGLGHGLLQQLKPFGHLTTHVRVWDRLARCLKPVDELRALRSLRPSGRSARCRWQTTDGRPPAPGLKRLRSQACPRAQHQFRPPSGTASRAVSSGHSASRAGGVTSASRLGRLPRPYRPG